MRDEGFIESREASARSFLGSVGSFRCRVGCPRVSGFWFLRRRRLGLAPSPGERQSGFLLLREKSLVGLSFSQGGEGPVQLPRRSKGIGPSRSKHPENIVQPRSSFRPARISGLARFLVRSRASLFGKIDESLSVRDLACMKASKIEEI